MHSPLRRAIALAGLAAALGLALVLPGAGAASGTHVTIRNFSFTPKTLSIHRGQSVTWVWSSGSTAHNVTGSHLHSRTQSHGSYTVRFTRAGTYSYHCTIHPFMTGKVVVH